MLATDVLGDGEEAADGEGTVGMGLAPGLCLSAELRVVGDDEEGEGEIASYLFK